jgi:methionine synthase II (cobalamin-independent)
MYPRPSAAQVESAAIAELVRAQRDRGLSIVTDGFVGRSRPVLCDQRRGQGPRAA